MGNGRGTCPLFLTSSRSSKSSRPAVRATETYCTFLQSPEALGVYTAPDQSQALPPPRSPAPPFTGVGGGGREGRGRCAGESSRLPEQQPGHRPDAHCPGSQDAGERAPQSARGRYADGGACGQRGLRTPHAAPGACCHGVGDRDGRLGDARLRSCRSPAPHRSGPAESSGVAGGCSRVRLPAPSPPAPCRPVGGGARSGAGAVT